MYQRKEDEFVTNDPRPMHQPTTEVIEEYKGEARDAFIEEWTLSGMSNTINVIDSMTGELIELTATDYFLNLELDIIKRILND